MKLLSSAQQLIFLLSMSSEQQSSSPAAPTPTPTPTPTACSIFVASSTDGYICDKNNSVDWLRDVHKSHPMPEGDDGGFTQYVNSVDAIIMGRKTYETVLSFKEWPYGDKPLYVLSRTPEKVTIPRTLVGDSVKTISGTAGPGREFCDPKSVLEKVAKEITVTHTTANIANGAASASSNNTNPNPNLTIHVYIDGGQCIRSFMDANLIQNVTITVVPVTLGENGGIPLFTKEQKDRLQKVSSTTMTNGFVQTNYKVL